MLSYDGAEDMIHHCLEGGGRVCEAKKHHCWFEQSVLGFECCLVFIPCLDSYIVVAPSNVQFSVYVGSLQVGNEVGYKQQGVLVVNGVVIYLPVVLYGV